MAHPGSAPQATVRRRLSDAIDLMTWPILTTVAAVIVPLDGGRLLHWIRYQPNDPDIVA